MDLLIHNLLDLLFKSSSCRYLGNVQSLKALALGFAPLLHRNT